MATMFNSLFAFLFLSLIAQGYGQPCSLANIGIAQSQTGKNVQGKPEWKVTISNNCACTQTNLKLSCNGFQTVEAVDPSVLSQSGGECLVNNGNDVVLSSPLSFNYAWDTSFPFKTLSSQINCS